MTENEEKLLRFSTNVRSLMLRFKDMREENVQLKTRLTEKDAMIEQLKGELVQMQHSYNTLKTAKMLEVADGDLEAAQKRLAKLIRSVDKCITLLNEQ